MRFFVVKPSVETTAERRQGFPNARVAAPDTAHFLLRRYKSEHLFGNPISLVS